MQAECIDMSKHSSSLKFAIKMIIYLFVLFLDHYIPFWVARRVLEAIPAGGYPLNEWLKGTSAPPTTTKAPFNLNREPFRVFTQT